MDVTDLLGTSIGVYIGLGFVLMGGAAFLTGQAIAGTWRPAWQVVAYGALLALALRFLVYALFEGRLLWLPGYLVDFAMLTAIALFAYRVTLVHKMVGQYPWLYRRRGLLSYEEQRPA